MPPDTAMMPTTEVVDAPTATPHPDPAESRRGGSVFVVDFHRDGNSDTYRTYGWSGQEQSHVWSVQGSCGLRLPPVADDLPLTIEIDFAICVGRDWLKAAVVRVMVNGRFVGSAVATGWTRLRCDVPADAVVANEPIELCIEHPCFVRMDLLDLNRENRVLGLCVYAVRLYPPWMKQAIDRFAPKFPEGKIVSTAMPPAAPSELPKPITFRFPPDQPKPGTARDGWLRDPHGETWADRRVCSLRLQAPHQPGQYLARFSMTPLFIRGMLTSQRINILLNGAVIGQFRSSTETAFTLPLPPELYEPGGILQFTFVLPDGWPMQIFDPTQQPNNLSFVLDSIEIAPLPLQHAALAGIRDDDVSVPAPIAVSDRFLDESVEELPGAVKAALDVEISEIFRHFESLGDNCAFGLAQRKAGCEILGLLRFGNTPLKALMTALADEFRGAANKDEVVMRLPDGAHGEYCLYVDRYGIRWHTNVYGGGDADESTVYAQQTMRLGYLRRKFYEALRAGRKIFTVSRGEPRKHPIPLPFADEPPVWEEKSERLRLPEVLTLFLHLNEYGTNTLLFLTRCAHDRRPGTVELLAPGVMRGYVDDFVITPEIENKDHVTWMRVAVNAWLLDRGVNASFRNKAAS